ncbi:Uncharacterised protein [Chlamydia trachomatis]|nr:Uncharacterised protein [Chlamydia trachomatis]
MKEKQTCRTLFQKLLFYFLLIQLSAGFGKPFIVRSKTTIMIIGDFCLVLTAPYMGSPLLQF